MSGITVTTGNYSPMFGKEVGKGKRRGERPKLYPCPICHRWNPTVSGVPGDYAVLCPRCGYTTDEFAAEVLPLPTMAAAINAWNGGV